MGRHLNLSSSANLRTMAHRFEQAARRLRVAADILDGRDQFAAKPASSKEAFNRLADQYEAAADALEGNDEQPAHQKLEAPSAPMPPVAHGPPTDPAVHGAGKEL